MSRSVDLFIEAELSLDDFAAALGRLLESPLEAQPDRAEWLLKEGEIRATLAEHPYGDDGELLFTRYRFALTARVGNDVRPHDTPEAALLRRVAQRIQRGPEWPVLLVHDLQYRDRAVVVGSPNGATAP
jgi:hypothetical protein